MKQLQLDAKYLEIVTAILKKYPYKFYAFGSRSKQNSKINSDLDIGFFDKIPFDVQVKIKDDFDESDFPYLIDLIDLIDFSRADKDFLTSIKPDLILLN